MANATTQPDVVRADETRIDIFDNGALIVPDPPDLDRHLSAMRAEFTPGGLQGHAHANVMWGRDSLGRCVVPVGLVPRVVAMLRDAGVTVKVTDRREFGPAHAVNAVIFGAARGEDRALLEALAGNPRGQIEADGHEVVRRMAQVYQLFPRAEIYVVAATRSDAWKLRERLQDALELQVGFAAGWTRRSGQRITVCTYGCLQRHLCDILLIANGAEALGKKAFAAVKEATGASVRAYAFVPVTQRFSVPEQLKLEALVGPVIHRAGPEPAAVRVALLPLRSSAYVKGLVGIERQRRVFWANRKRNVGVAAEAQAFASGDLTREWERELGTPIRTVVVVESPEHGRRLLARLPGWRLAAANEEGRRLPESGQSSQDMDRVVVTMTYAAQNELAADVVIRADGGAGPLPGFPPRRTTCPCGVLLLDVVDNAGGDCQAMRDTGLRLASYAAHGWIGRHPLDPFGREPQFPDDGDDLDLDLSRDDAGRPPRRR